MNKAQRNAVVKVEFALMAAAKAGLVLRVYDGEVLLAPKESTSSPEYQQDNKADWKGLYACKVGRGIDADGGAGA